MNHGDGKQTIAAECYDQAVEELALYMITTLNKDLLSKRRDWPTKQYVLEHLDTDQLVADIADRIQKLKST